MPPNRDRIARYAIYLGKITEPSYPRRAAALTRQRDSRRDRGKKLFWFSRAQRRPPGSSWPRRHRRPAEGRVMKVEVKRQIAAQLDINPPRPRLNPVLGVPPAGRGARAKPRHRPRLAPAGRIGEIQQSSWPAPARFPLQRVQRSAGAATTPSPSFDRSPTIARTSSARL